MDIGGRTNSAISLVGGRGADRNDVKGFRLGDLPRVHLGRDPGDAVVGDGGTGRIGSAGATGKSVGTAVAIGATDILPRGGGPTGVFAAVNMRAVVKELFVVLIFIHPFGGSRPGGTVGGIADGFAGA